MFLPTTFLKKTNSEQITSQPLTQNKSPWRSKPLTFLHWYITNKLFSLGFTWWLSIYFLKNLIEIKLFITKHQVIILFFLIFNQTFLKHFDQEINNFIDQVYLLFFLIFVNEISWTIGDHLLKLTNCYKIYSLVNKFIIRLWKIGKITCQETSASNLLITFVNKHYLFFFIDIREIVDQRENIRFLKKE